MPAPSGRTLGFGRGKASWLRQLGNRLNAGGSLDTSSLGEHSSPGAAKEGKSTHMTTVAESENCSALLDRLQKLENENRKMKQFGALVLVAIAVLILMGQAGKSGTPNRALDADSLVIRDANGNVRIELGLLDGHSPFLRMYGGTDYKRASLVLTSDQKGSELMFLGGNALIMLHNDDNPALLLAGGGGGTSIEPQLVTTYDSDNFHTFVGRMATVDDRTGSTTWSTAASLKLVRKDGKVIWEAP